MKREVLPIRTLILWQIRVVMLTTLLTLLCFFYADALSFLRYVGIGVAFLGFVGVVWYLPMFFKGYEILIRNEAIIINYGVIMKVSHIMPHSRLIYAQSFATPLARVFGVTALSLKAARSRVIVPEIILKDALAVIESLTGEVSYEKDV